MSPELIDIILLLGNNLDAVPEGGWRHGLRTSRDCLTIQTLHDFHNRGPWSRKHLPLHLPAVQRFWQEHLRRWLEDRRVPHSHAWWKAEIRWNHRLDLLRRYLMSQLGTSVNLCRRQVWRPIVLGWRCSRWLLGPPDLRVMLLKLHVAIDSCLGGFLLKLSPLAVDILLKAHHLSIPARIQVGHRRFGLFVDGVLLCLSSAADFFSLSPINLVDPLALQRIVLRKTLGAVMLPVLNRCSELRSNRRDGLRLHAWRRAPAAWGSEAAR